MKRFGKLFVWLFTWGGTKTGKGADLLHPMVRVAISFIAFFILLVWIFGAFTGCQKIENPEKDKTNYSFVNPNEKKGGIPGGPNGQGGGNGNNPNNPPPNYVKIDDTFDFNFQVDTLTCGYLHLTWDSPSNYQYLREFLKHGNMANNCSGPEVVGNNVLINPLASCAFEIGQNYPDVFMFSFYTLGDTTFTWTSTQVESITVGAIRSFDCN